MLREALNSPWLWILGSLSLLILSLRWILPSTRESARSLLQNLQIQYSETHDYAAASPRDYPWLDLDFYDRMAGEIEKLGFTRVGDFEDLTASRMDGYRPTFARTLVSSDGTVVAMISDSRIKGWLRIVQWMGRIPRKLSTISFATERPDGRSIGTLSAPRADPLTLPPEFSVENHPAGTPPGALLEAHRAHVQRHLQAEPGAAPCLFRTLDDVKASLDRRARIRHAHRKSIGWLTREEVGRMLSSGAEEYYREIQSLQNNDRNPA